MAGDARSDAVAYWKLEVDGKFSGLLQEYTGTPGVPQTTLKPSGPQDLLKHWLNASMTGTGRRHNVSVVGLNYRLQMVSRNNFLSAAVTRVTFPVLSGAEKDPVYLEIGISCTNHQTLAGDHVQDNDARLRARKRLMFPGNYRLAIGGVDCRKVSSISSIEVSLTPARVSDLAVTMSESEAGDFMEHFAVRGNTSAKKDGTLEFLDEHRTAPYFTLNLSRLGLISPSMGGRPPAPRSLHTIVAQPAAGPGTHSNVHSARDGRGSNMSTCVVKMSCEKAILA